MSHHSTHTEALGSASFGKLCGHWQKDICPQWSFHRTPTHSHILLCVQCIAAGSHIANHEVESAELRPYATHLSKVITKVRQALRLQSCVNRDQYPQKVRQNGKKNCTLSRFQGVLIWSACVNSQAKLHCAIKWLEDTPKFIQAFPDNWSEKHNRLREPEPEG